MPDIKLTFDGHGLNDANDPYKARVLTFAQSVPDADAARIAALLVAAPDLLEAARNAGNVLAALATGQLEKIDRNSPALAQLRAAIAKATGGAA